MFVSFWGAVGSNTMLLYLAALTNVPGELYEAADIDGARPFDRFWNVTWPQLAPTTFFVVVMSMIGGLQGGFEMVRTMTSGGPAGGEHAAELLHLRRGLRGRAASASPARSPGRCSCSSSSSPSSTGPSANRYVND